MLHDFWNSGQPHNLFSSFSSLQQILFHGGDAYETIRLRWEGGDLEIWGAPFSTQSGWNLDCTAWGADSGKYSHNISEELRHAWIVKG